MPNAIPLWYHLGPIITGLISVIPVTYVIYNKWKRDPPKKLTLGAYTAFWLGEGILFAITQAMTDHELDGETPQRFYTELWFYPLLFLVIWPTTVLVTNIFEDDAEKRGRPKSIRHWPSQFAHNKVCLPIVLTLTAWASITMLDNTESYLNLAAYFGIIAFWFLGVMIIWDGKKAMPQTELQWTRFQWATSLVAFGLTATLQFAT